MRDRCRWAALPVLPKRFAFCLAESRVISYDPFMKTPTLSTFYIHSSLGRSALLLVSVLIGCFGLLPKAQAVSPAPDGGYPGGNTAEGQAALLSLTTGGFNTAVGFLSLRSDSTGAFNTAVGAGTLLANTGDENTATGAGALLSNTGGTFNMANGAFALFANTSGFQNTAAGFEALFNNTTGIANTATGAFALLHNTTSTANTATGDAALLSNVSGNNNTAIGASALGSNTADGNTAVGTLALLNNTTGFLNIALGAGAGESLTTGSHNIDIGNAGVTGEGNTIRIGDDNQGATFIAGVYGVSVAGLGVAMNSSGQLGTVGSSRRFKKDIKAMEHASESILSLKPVTFRYNEEIDALGTPQFGLIAEDVADVNPDLVVNGRDGKPYTVRYEAVNAMLLNEFLKEHHKIRNLEVTIAQQRKDFQAATTQQQGEFEAKIARQQKQIEALSAGLQKVNAQLAAASPSRGGLAASKFASGRIRSGGPAPQVVNNP